MAEQDKANITSNLTADTSNKVQTSKKKPSAKLKSSTVKDIISKSRTLTGSRPDEININPVQEAVEKKAVFAFGRFNPPTTGHEKLIHKVESEAKKTGGEAHIIASHTEGNSRNPIPKEKKVGYLKKVASPGTHVSSSSSEHPTLLHQLSKLHKSGVQHLTMVAGSDRVKDYHDVIHKYNGQENKHGHYNFKSIKVVSAGQRDPDAEGATGISGTKMREHAKSGNMKAFKSGLPKALHPHAEEIANHIKSVKEDFNDIDINDILLISEQLNDLQDLDENVKKLAKNYLRNAASVQKDKVIAGRQKPIAVEEVNDKFGKMREALPRSNQDRKKMDITVRQGEDRKTDDRPYRQQSIQKKIVDEAFSKRYKSPWEKIEKAKPGIGKRIDTAVADLKQNAKDYQDIVDKEKKKEVKEATTTSDVAVWDKPPPKGKSKKLSSVQKARAKARAKAAGRPYPNLIDNMAVAKEETIHELSNELIGKVNKIRTLTGVKSKTPAATDTLNKAVEKVRSRTDVGAVK